MRETASKRAGRETRHLFFYFYCVLITGKKELIIVYILNSTLTELPFSIYFNSVITKP